MPSVGISGLMSFLLVICLAPFDAVAIHLNDGHTQSLRAQAVPAENARAGTTPLSKEFSMLRSWLNGPSLPNEANLSIEPAQPLETSFSGAVSMGASNYTGLSLPDAEIGTSLVGTEGGIQASWPITIRQPHDWIKKLPEAMADSKAEVANDTSTSVSRADGHLRRELVVAKYDEDVSWLKRLPINFNVTVYQSKDSSEPHFVENYGNEAAKYLSYILDNYDDLPDFMTFVQAGRQDWHDTFPKDTTLARWDWEVAAEHGGMAYLPTAAPCLVEDSEEVTLAQAAADADKVQRQRPQCNGVVEHRPKQMATLRDVWDDVFRQELGALPHRWITTCCAQFEVTREAVQRHPLNFYRLLFDWVMDHDRSLVEADTDGAIRRNHDAERRDAGHVMEVAWVLLFSGDDAIAPDSN